MNSAELRKFSLKCFIGFLVLTGLLAVLMVLVGRFGELELKILLSTLVVSAANVCALSCAAVMERHGYRAAGISGIGFAVAAGVMTLLGVWVDIHNEFFWKSTITAVICAAAMAHMFLLLLPKLKSQHRWFQILSSGVLILLAGMLNLLVWSELDSDGYFRALAAVAIIAVILTLVTPLLARLANTESVEQSELMLRQITLTADPKQKGVFIGDDGCRYQLQKVSGS